MGQVADHRLSRWTFEQVIYVHARAWELFGPEFTMRSAQFGFD